jgi:hypothetical protein
MLVDLVLCHLFLPVFMAARNGIPGEGSKARYVTYDNVRGLNKRALISGRRRMLAGFSF